MSITINKQEIKSSAN